MAGFSREQIVKFRQMHQAKINWLKSGRTEVDWYMSQGTDYVQYDAWVKQGMPNVIDPSTIKVPEQASFTTSKYTKTNTSFSGADIVATITPLGGKPVVFGELQTISYSIYRPTTPVYALGRINPKGIVRGPRTIAGSLIFTVFDRHVLKEIMEAYSTDNTKFGDALQDTYGFSENELVELKKYGKTDELPPFDVNISFMNEYGQSATLNLYGLYIITEGQTMSIEDMITENTMQYIAMDIDLMDYTRIRTDNPY